VTDGYLVPGRTHTERHHAVYRRHSKWVSQWIKGRAKTSYELRRYAGSRLLDMGATIFEVRDFLRHRDVQTTQQWYAYRLQNRQLRTIGMGSIPVIANQPKNSSPTNLARNCPNRCLNHFADKSTFALEVRHKFPVSVDIE
jgi:hypothetical protein